MRVDEYRRLHSICLDMAKQPSVPEVRARWLAMAAHCMKLAIERTQPRPRLSLMIDLGSPRVAIRISSSRATLRPDKETSATAARHSRVQSS
jgi:hypothetical protein